MDYKIEEIAGRWQIRVKSWQLSRWKHYKIQGYYQNPGPDGYECHASFKLREEAEEYIRDNLVVDEISRQDKN